MAVAEDVRVDADVRVAEPAPQADTPTPSATAAARPRATRTGLNASINSLCAALPALGVTVALFSSPQGARLAAARQSAAMDQ